MAEQFGAVYAESIARDHVLSDLDGQTVNEALDAGIAPKIVWRAVCEAFEVPVKQR